MFATLARSLSLGKAMAASLCIMICILIFFTWRKCLFLQGGTPSASPGYGISLVAETTAGRFISAERCLSGAELLEARDAQVTADDIGVQVACLLLDEVKRYALHGCDGNVRIW
jgi:hypothetical protein